jgi:hypothetical protein
MPLMGQGYQRAAAAERAEAAFGEDAAVRKVLTVRGRTGLRLNVSLCCLGSRSACTTQSQSPREHQP